MAKVKVSKMKAIVDKIVQWAVDRGLDKAEPTKQMLKLMEETGELAAGLAKSQQDKIRDSVGDIAVVLIVLCTQLGINFEDCVDLAYGEIRNRKGKLVNGVFIKEADLPEEGK